MCQKLYGSYVLYNGFAAMDELLATLAEVVEDFGCNVPSFTLTGDVTGYFTLVVFVNNACISTKLETWKILFEEIRRDSNLKKVKR